MHYYSFNNSVFVVHSVGIHEIFVAVRSLPILGTIKHLRHGLLRSGPYIAGGQRVKANITIAVINTPFKTVSDRHSQRITMEQEHNKPVLPTK